MNNEEIVQRRTRVFTMRLAGASINQISEIEGVNRELISRILEQALQDYSDEDINSMRALENARLDSISTGLLKKAREGSVRAAGVYLRLSERRARLNGLDAPLRITVGASVRIEMETALSELEETITKIIPSTVIASRPELEDE